MRVCAAGGGMCSLRVCSRRCVRTLTHSNLATGGDNVNSLATGGNNVNSLATGGDNVISANLQSFTAATW